jgi:hypothetical protein
MDVPNVRRTEYQLVSCLLFFRSMLLNSHPLKVNIDDGFLNLMSQDGASKDDVRVPEGELGVTITAAFEEGKDTLVTIVSAMGEEQVSFPRADWLECARLLAFRPFRSKRPPRVPSPHSLLLVGYLSSLRRYFSSFPSAPAFYAHPFIVLTDVTLLCMYLFMA